MFELLDMSWAKRRPLNDAEKNIIENVEVIDFQMVKGHRCVVNATVNGEELALNGRVYARETYEINEDGTTDVILHGWGVQGTNHLGISVGLRYIEEES